MEKVGRYGFMAEPFHCDFSGRLFMGHLGNHLLNAADFHSTDRGFGMKRLMSMNRSWVLSRLAIEMTEMPRQYTRFTIETWVESAMRYFTSRNFCITELPPTAEGDSQSPTPSAIPPKVLGYGRSIWAMIDTETRQPTDIFSIDDGAIDNWIESGKPCPIDKGGRARMSDQAQLVREIDTYYNDVDINGHVNSVKYIEHVLDLWPIDWYREHSIRRFEIAYVAEAHAGERLAFYCEQAGTAQGDLQSPLEFCIRICKIVGDASERCTPVVGDASERCSLVVGDASERCSPVVGDASERCSPVVGDASERCTPVVGDASERCKERSLVEVARCKVYFCSIL